MPLKRWLGHWQEGNPFTDVNQMQIVTVSGTSAYRGRAYQTQESYQRLREGKQAVAISSFPGTERSESPRTFKAQE